MYKKKNMLYFLKNFYNYFDNTIIIVMFDMTITNTFLK